MNRRTFLLAVGATACGGKEVVRPRRRKRAPGKSETATGAGPTLPHTSVNPYEYQHYRSSLAVHGDSLIQNVKGDLWRLDMRTRERTAVYAQPRVSYCFLLDGTFAIFALDRDTDRYVLHRIHANGTVDTIQGPSFPLSVRKATHVLPASSPAQVYVTRETEIVQLEKVRGELAQTAAFAIPHPNSGNRNQMFSLHDGRVVCVGDGFSVVGPNTPALQYGGKERWRKEVPAAITQDTFTMLSRTGFLAVTANHVVLRALKDQLLIWDASNGNPIV